MKRILIPFLTVSILSFFDGQQAFANCTATFTSIPDFVVTGDGTCKHQDDIAGLTDLLQVNVLPGANCDPDDCTVEVMATWAGGNDSVTKGPRWPHDV